MLKPDEARAILKGEPLTEEEITEILDETEELGKLRVLEAEGKRINDSERFRELRGREGRATKAGGKRKLPTRNEFPPLGGMNQRVSEKTHAIVALSLHGFNDRRIGQIMGVEPSGIYNLRRAHPKEFDQARQFHLQMAMREYGENLIVASTGMSRVLAGAPAKLQEILDGRKTPPGIKLKAVEVAAKVGALLKPRERAGKPQHNTQIVNIVKSADDIEGESHVVDIEDAEIITDETSPSVAS